MTAPYTTSTGPKQECREAFIAAVRDNIADPRNFFLLPSKDAHDAELVHQNWPKARITGVEKSTTIFAHLDREYVYIQPYQMTVHQYVSTFRHIKQSKFDAAFIDYTGTASLTNVADVCDFTSYLTAPTFILGLTFVKNARIKMAEVEDMIKKDTVWLDETECYGEKPINTSLNIAAMVCDAIDRGVSPGGREKTRPLAGKLSSLEILEEREYQASESSTLMYFIILRIQRFAPLSKG